MSAPFDIWFTAQGKAMMIEIGFLIFCAVMLVFGWREVVKSVRGERKLPEKPAPEEPIDFISDRPMTKNRCTRCGAPVPQGLHGLCGQCSFEMHSEHWDDDP